MQNFLLFLLCRLTDLYYICWKESFNKENMQLIDGKAISEQVKQEIAAEVAEIVAKGGKRPHLAAILVGHDGGSETYVAAKVKACEVCGFKSSLIRYEADVTEEELLQCLSLLSYSISYAKGLRYRMNHAKDRRNVTLKNLKYNNC